tara:strand:- start:327 stop:596 length:270 start_codon:yes stop_codon:yes gene_type:complete
MKITRQRLKKIIKEEISTLSEGDFAESAIPLLDDIINSIGKAHKSLPAGPRGKEFFEETLLHNIELLRKRWRKEREGDEAAAQRLLEPA